MRTLGEASGSLIALHVERLKEYRMCERRKKKKTNPFVDYTSNVFQENSLPAMKIKRCEEGRKVPAAELRVTFGCGATAPGSVFNWRLSGLQLALRSSHLTRRRVSVFLFCPLPLDFPLTVNCK